MTETMLQITGEFEGSTHQGVQIRLPGVVAHIVPDNHGPYRPPHPARCAPAPGAAPPLEAQDSAGSGAQGARHLLRQGGEGIVKSWAGQDTSGAVDFDSIYHSYRRRVYTLCLRMTRNQADAEDLTQEAFLRLFRKIGTFRGDSAFTTWLHRLVVNVVLARLRKKSPLECSIDSDDRLEGETSPSQESLGALDTTLISAIDRLSLEVAVAELPVGFRRVFVLHDVEGYEHNEIAQILGVSEGTSKSQLHRARGRLRDLLKHSRPRNPRWDHSLASNGQDQSGDWEGMQYR